MLTFSNPSQFLKDYKNYVEEKGIKHSYIADKLDISRQQLYALYKKKEPTIKDIYNLCDAIDIGININFYKKET